MGGIIPLEILFQIGDIDRQEHQEHHDTTMTTNRVIIWGLLILRRSVE